MFLAYIFLSALLLMLLIFRIYKANSRFFNALRKIPGPPTFPGLGNLLTLNVPIEKQWNVVRKITRKYYPITKIWLGPLRPIVSIRHPDDLEALLSSQKHIDKGQMYNYLHPWLKTGLLTSAGEKWRRRRKILTPAFHFNILKKYMDITNENGIEFIEALKAEGKETTQSLVPLCSKYTLNIILESAMGVALGKMDKETAREYTTAVQKNTSIIVYRIARPYIRDWMMKPIFKLGRMQNQALKILHDFTSKVVKERREYHKSNQNDLEEFTSEKEDQLDSEAVIGRKKRLAMLDLLLSSENEGLIDNEGIKEEVDTFTFEGHDTTAMSMTFTLMLLAENKEIQEIARAEVTDVLDRSSGNMTMTELQEMNYLERCIKESLRMYPPVATMSRDLKHDLQLKNYLIPSGVEAVFHVYDVHRDPNYWVEPDKFDPDRFLPERMQNRHPYSYIPFSAGPRNCIGQKFALMELKSLIARILYNFRLEPVSRLSDMEVLLDIVIRPAHPVYTKFIRIDK